jgi:AcrR family transcriptional regulator
VTQETPSPSPRKLELLEAAYGYVLAHGLADLSLRPLAAAIGSSPRVLLFLFGSKDGLIQALLARARADELSMLENLSQDRPVTDLAGAALEIWTWLSDPAHRSLLVLWVEGYSRSLVEPEGPWINFANQTVAAWLDVLAAYQPMRARRTAAGKAQRTVVLALLRGALLDLLATNDRRRVDASIRLHLGTIGTSGH